jgi:serine kinase of HPr protein (carbohydrate metabolism regulator)
MVKQKPQTLLENAQTGKEVIQLNRWEEAKGRLEDISVKDDILRIELSSIVLEYRTGSQLADILLSKLEGHQGESVGILRCENHIEPIVVQIQ